LSEIALSWFAGPHPGINEHYAGDDDIVYQHAFQ
jgi:hypothetical protein